MKTPDTINGKTPEEVKKGLCCCVTDIAGCKGCPFDNSSDDGLVWECTVDSSALAYIQQLESRLAQAERERDAAVMDIETAINSKTGLGCHLCKYNGVYDCLECVWEWRGVCQENTKEDAE